MPTRIDYNGLEAFVAIAQLGSFNKAAEYLNMSQAALSHRIRKLESDMGMRLLVRTTRDVSLSAAGQRLLPVARRNLEELTEAYSAVQMQGKAQRRRLSFACLPTIAHYYLPEIMQKFADAYPKIALQLQDQPAGRVTELVQKGDVEFGITITGVQHWDLEFRPIRQEPYVLLVSRNHPLARSGSISRTELNGLRFVRINTQSTNRQMVHDTLGDVGDTIDWRYEVQNATMAMALVAQGAAVTVLPKLTADLGKDDVVGLTFDDIDLSRTLGVVTRRGAPLSPEAETLLELITHRLDEG